MLEGCTEQASIWQVQPSDKLYSAVQMQEPKLTFEGQVNAKQYICLYFRILASRFRGPPE